MEFLTNIKLEDYENQSWFQTTAIAASKSRGTTEGLYKIAKIVINVLLYPITLLPQVKWIASLKDLFSSFKDLHDFTLITEPVAQWVDFGFNKSEQEKVRKNDATAVIKLADRISMTVGGILKTTLIGHKLGLWNLGRVASFAVGNVPILGAVADTIFAVHFGLSAVKNGITWHKSQQKIQISSRLHKKWTAIGTRTDRISALRKKVQDLKNDLITNTQLTDTEKNKINEKIKKNTKVKKDLKNLSDDDFVKMKTKSLEKYKIHLINLKKVRAGAICGLFSDLGKIAVIALHVVAMQIFGWVGLAAQLTVISLSLASELVGFGKFLTKLQGVKEVEIPGAAQQAAAAA